MRHMGLKICIGDKTHRYNKYTWNMSGDPKFLVDLTWNDPFVRFRQVVESCCLVVSRSRCVLFNFCESLLVISLVSFLAFSASVCATGNWAHNLSVFDSQIYKVIPTPLFLAISLCYTFVFMYIVPPMVERVRPSRLQRSKEVNKNLTISWMVSADKYILLNKINTYVQT